MSILDDLTRAVEELRESNTQNKIYSGNDRFFSEGKEIFSVEDYWQYMYGQIGSHAGELAEFFVAKALGIDRAENLNYWAAYDMSYKSRRVEVKETQYVHSWNKKGVSKVRTFSIAPSNNDYWLKSLKLNPEKKLARQSDMYVFCLNTNQDYEKRDPLNIDLWEFYIVPTFEIDQYTERCGNPDQKKISLGVVRKMAGEAVKYSDIQRKVDEVLIRVDEYLLKTYEKADK